MSEQPPSVRVILSGVRSVTHLVYAASWLRQALDGVDGVVEVVVLDVGAGFGQARVDEHQVRTYLPQHPRMELVTVSRDEHWAAEKGVERVLLSIGAPGTRAWARLLLAGRVRPPRVVVVDEGIGSFGNARSRREAYRRQGGHAVRAAVRAAVVSTAARFLTDVHWSLYERAAGGWVLRDEVAAEFRRLVSGPSPGSARAVYLTQPWPDIGVMSEASYLAHLHAVRDQCSLAGVALALRPHPSEDVGRYAGFELLSGSEPAELSREVVESVVVIGSNSTALLNLAAVHASPAVRVTAPGLEGLEAALTSAQRTLLDTFLPPPVTIDELGSHLTPIVGPAPRNGAPTATPASDEG